MALINCPECSKRISDKASACIECGFPLVNLHTASSSKAESAPVYDRSQLPVQPASPMAETIKYQGSYQGQHNYSPQQLHYYQHDYKQEANTAATISATCAIIGIFFMPASIVLGIIALVQRSKAKKLGYSYDRNTENRFIGDKTRSGIVLGIIDIVFGVFFWLAILL